jgi:N-acetylglucosamine kinase-like BadF-type ATPase
VRTILGIDQGGTKTHAAVADETGRILGVGRGRGACHSIQGMEAAMAGVAEAVRGACEASGVHMGAIAAVAAGMTGVDWPDEAELLQRALAGTLGLPRETIRVVNDCIVALRAATSSPAGCILCAGTGLNCGVRDGRGGEYTFGYYIPDADQGGMALGRRVLQAVYDAESGVGPATALTSAVLERTGCASADELLRRQVSGRLESRLVLQLPLVAEETALAGDEASIALLRRFGRDVAAYAVAGLRRFHLEGDAIEVVLSGGVFKCRAPALLEAVRAEIRKAAPRAVVVDSPWEPVVGAVLLAMDGLEGADADEFQRNVRRNAPRFHLVRQSS